MLRTGVKLFAEIIADTFHGCYKNGLNNTYDFTYLSSVPMIAVLLYVPVSNIKLPRIDVDSSTSMLYVFGFINNICLY